MSNLFAGRKLCIATMHGKQRVIAPHVERTLSVHCSVAPEGFDSDRYGTFSGEVPRRGTPLEAARRKAEAAMQLSGLDLAIASEGSFVPHPEVGLIPIGIEHIVLFDRSNDLEIVGEHVTTETNHAHRECHSLDDACDFARRIGFPEHGLLLVMGEPPVRILRDLRDHEALVSAVHAIRAESLSNRLPWFALSDLRADRNPTRMRAIDQAAAALAKRAATPCPKCALPGFGQVDSLRGLPCACCGVPSNWVRAIVQGCAGCSCRREILRVDGLTTVDPGSCSFCNP
ncbi:MAG: hypothetical protein ACI9SE_000089 [Neolewinella sp.]|jgi:hypothetical protein